MELRYNEMMDLLKTKPEFSAKIEVVDEVEVTIFSYNVAFSDTFDSDLALEFRGTVFRNDTKECICRPFKKFFNIGERKGSKFDDINWNNAEYYTKFDGSMITPVLINDKIFMKSKKSFYSDVAITAQKIYEDSITSFSDFIFNLLDRNYTPIFELIGPTNQVVISYNDSKLIYLGNRGIYTGDFFPNHVIENKTVKYEEISDMTDIEGFVIWDGKQLFKRKTNWYLERHHLISEYNEKKLIQLILTDKFDDALSILAGLNNELRMKQFMDLNDKVLRYKMDLEKRIAEAWKKAEKYKDNRKDFAIFVNSFVDKDLHHFLFSKLDGKVDKAKMNKHISNHFSKNEEIDNN